MAKRKAKTRGKPKGKSWWSQLFHFIVLPPVRRVIIVVIIIGLLFWQWSTLTSWARGTWQLLGWGLILIAIALAALVWVVWRCRLSSLIYHGNRWLGGIAFILAVWGILGFLNLGGSFGLAIIGQDIVYYPVWDSQYVTAVARKK